MGHDVHFGGRFALTRTAYRKESGRLSDPARRQARDAAMVLYRMLDLSLTDLVCTVSDPLFSPAARSDHGLVGEVVYLTGVCA